MKIVEALTRQDFITGDVVGEGLTTYYKSLKETAGIYVDSSEALASEEMAYYVTSQLNNKPDDNKEALNWGVTSMYPLTVNGEFCMTRGHFHLDRDYPEYYLCTAGEGHLLCWDGADEVICYHLTPGAVVYIDGRLAHRLINTGHEMFKVAACWAGKSGNDYQTIEERGFPVRAFKVDGNIEWRKA